MANVKQPPPSIFEKMFSVPIEDKLFADIDVLKDMVKDMMLQEEVHDKAIDTLIAKLKFGPDHKEDKQSSKQPTEELQKAEQPTEELQKGVEAVREYIKSSLINTDFNYITAMKAVENKKQAVCHHALAEAISHNEQLQRLKDLKALTHPGVIPKSTKLNEINNLLDKNIQTVSALISKISERMKKAEEDCDEEIDRLKTRFVLDILEHRTFVGVGFKGLVRAAGLESSTITEELDAYFEHWLEGPAHDDS